MRGDARQTLDILAAPPGAAEFRAKFAEPERPLLIRGLASGWPARGRWTRDWLRPALRRNPDVKDRGVFFLSRKPVLEDDIEMPAFLEETLNSDRVMPDSVAWRFWINNRNNKTEFHYDTNAENVVTVQVRGRKEWVLVSPDTPLPCYPFTNFAVLKDEERLLAGKVFHKFVLEEGDLLYIPPQWYHRAIGMDEENININWTFTKRETSVVTRESRRDLERCSLLDAFRNSRSSLVRGAYRKIIAALPNVGGIGWGLKAYVASPYQPGRAALTFRFFAELLKIPVALTTIPRIRATLNKVDKT